MSMRPLSVSVVILAIACSTGCRNAVDENIKALESAPPHDRRRAAINLAQMGPAAKNAVPALIRALKDEDVNVRTAAVEALGKIGPVTDDVVPALIGMLKDKDKQVPYGAAVALGNIGPAAKEATPDLILALDNQDAFSYAAAEALATFGPAAVPALIEKCKEKQNAPAAYGLGRIGPAAKDAIPALREAMKLQNKGNYTYEALRFEAAAALAMIDPSAKDAVAIVVGRLKGNNEANRIWVARRLGEIGPAASDAVPTLQAASENDPSADVRGAAAIALKKILPK